MFNNLTCAILLINLPSPRVKNENDFVTAAAGQFKSKQDIVGITREKRNV